MSNIYFPDQTIDYNDLFFVCYMIERTARSIHQRNRYVVEQLGRDGLARQLSIAETTHCLNPEAVVAAWKEEYELQPGSVDVTAVDPRFTDKYPTDLQMGKVYARLISSIAGNDDLIDTIQKVYASPVCDTIDNYNTGAYYEPSYIQTQAFLNGGF